MQQPINRKSFSSFSAPVCIVPIPIFVAPAATGELDFGAKAL
jgi:hypothetical protein